MDAPARIPTSVKQYEELFPLKKNDIGVICGKPTFTLLQPLHDALEKNLIAMPDERDTIYGKLHLLEDTSQLAGGPDDQVEPSTNQGQMEPFLAATTVRERHNNVMQHNNAQTQWLEDNNANEACKNLVIKIVDKVYLEKLYNERFGFKGKTLRDFMDHFIEKYQATPEERAAVKALIDQPWDTNKHIINLFSQLKKQLTILAEMKNSIPYPEEVFLEALYMAVQKNVAILKSMYKVEEEGCG